MPRQQMEAGSSLLFPPLFRFRETTLRRSQRFVGLLDTPPSFGFAQRHIEARRSHCRPSRNRGGDGASRKRRPDWISTDQTSRESDRTKRSAQETGVFQAPELNHPRLPQRCLDSLVGLPGLSQRSRVSIRRNFRKKDNPILAHDIGLRVRRDSENDKIVRLGCLYGSQQCFFRRSRDEEGTGRTAAARGRIRKVPKRLASVTLDAHGIEAPNSEKRLADRREQRAINATGAIRKPQADANEAAALELNGDPFVAMKDSHPRSHDEHERTNAEAGENR